MPMVMHEIEELPAEVEDQLRLRAFRVFYYRSFRNEHDLTVRFVKAVIASAGPIRDREALTEWYRNHRRGLRTS